MNATTLQAVLASPHRCVIAVTGGGSAALSELLAEPGASRTLLQGIVPYHPAALEEFLGFKPPAACCEGTARAMAVRAYQLACRFAPDEAASLLGVGCTASLATDRPKRGQRRYWIALHSAQQTSVMGRTLRDPEAKRSVDEAATAEAVLAMLAYGCGVGQSPDCSSNPPPDATTWRQEDFGPEGAGLWLGERSSLYFENGSGVAAVPRVLAPGSFAPPHAGHLAIARIAGERGGGPVAFELSIDNVDKPSLDHIELRDRLAGLAGWPVLVTRAATFDRKAQIAPGSTFAIGADTAARLADVRYYGGETIARDDALATIGAQGCRFLVFGRTIEGCFVTLDRLGLPPQLLALCDGVAESEFREDIASRDLRGPA